MTSGNPMKNKQIQRLYSFEDIRNIIAQYGLGADRLNDPDILGPLFAKDAIWRCEGFGEFKGRKAIKHALRSIAETRILWSFHAMATPWINVCEKNLTATAKWALWELSKVTDDSGHSQDSIMAGFYDTRLVHEESRWLIKHMDLKICLQSPYPAEFITPHQDRQT